MMVKTLLLLLQELSSRSIHDHFLSSHYTHRTVSLMTLDLFLIKKEKVKKIRKSEKNGK